MKRRDQKRENQSWKVGWAGQKSVESENQGRYNRLYILSYGSKRRKNIVKTTIVKKNNNKNLNTKEDHLSAFANFMSIDIANGAISPHTLKNYSCQILLFLKWCKENNIDPKTATKEDIKNYRQYLLQLYSRASIAMKLKVVKRFFDALVIHKLRPDNPAIGVKTPRELTARKEKIKWLSIEEIQKLLLAPNINTQKGKRDRAIFVLMAMHGLRVGEVAAIKMSDVDMTAKKLTVHGKGSKNRTVHLIEESVSCLQTWMNARTAKDEFLFVSVARGKSFGKGMSIKGIWKMVNQYLSELGLKKEGMSCHSLRHTFATQALAAGANIYAISRSLGHASVLTTQVYADLVNEKKENPATLLGNVFLPKLLEKNGQ